MYLKAIVLAFAGLAAGGMVAAGTFAFIVMIGVFTRLASRTHTAQYASLYENAVVLGGSLGNIVFIYQIQLPLYQVGTIFFGLFSGIFVGCLAVALAEVLKVFPVLVRRVGLIEGLPIVMLCVALGKLVGSMLQFFMGWR